MFLSLFSLLHLALICCVYAKVPSLYFLVMYVKYHFQFLNIKNWGNNYWLIEISHCLKKPILHLLTAGLCYLSLSCLECTSTACSFSPVFGIIGVSYVVNILFTNNKLYYYSQTTNERLSVLDSIKPVRKVIYDLRSFLYNLYAGKKYR